MYKKIFTFIHDHILYLNSTKYFAGIVMIMLNIGSKFITIEFSKSTEEYLKMNITKQLLVFSMSWMGTRDIYTALILTAVFTILSDHIFNEESPYCCVPEKYRVLHKIKDKNNENNENDEEVNEIELNNAIAILEKAKREQQRKKQQQNFLKFNNIYISPLEYK